jgi:hypothetical protein
MCKKYKHNLVSIFFSIFEFNKNREENTKQTSVEEFSYG